MIVYIIKNKINEKDIFAETKRKVKKFQHFLPR